MAEIYKAPSPIPRKSLFLAGSIDMGSAVDWQAVVQEALDDLPIMIFNPRRDDWDKTWTQSIKNEPFKEQVVWELEQLECADVICFYFDPKGMSPITLLELGLYAMSGKPIVVCCPEGFWRRGNIEVVCDRYGIPLYDYIGDMITQLRKLLT